MICEDFEGCFYSDAPNVENARLINEPLDFHNFADRFYPPGEELFFICERGFIPSKTF